MSSTVDHVSETAMSQLTIHTSASSSMVLTEDTQPPSTDSTDSDRHDLEHVGSSPAMGSATAAPPPPRPTQGPLKTPSTQSGMGRIYNSLTNVLSGGSSSPKSESSPGLRATSQFNSILKNVTGSVCSLC